MKWLKLKWPYVLALALCTTIMSMFLFGIDFCLSHPSEFPFLEETCSLANIDLKYKYVLLILLMSLISCSILNLFTALFSYFLKKVTEVKKDENH